MLLAFACSVLTRRVSASTAYLKREEKVTNIATAEFALAELAAFLVRHYLSCPFPCAVFGRIPGVFRGARGCAFSCTPR